jgi:predicted Zn-dependent peptidase
METKIIRNKNYTLNLITTTKFKTTRIHVNFANELKEDTVTKRSILPYLMHAVSQKHNSREKMSKYLENLYAANFNVGVSRIGKTHFISFELSIINDNFTFNNELLFHKSLNFLQEVLFHPYFDKQIFIEESRLLKEYYSSIYSNKMKYAVKEMRNIMFENEIYKIDPLGNEEDLNNIDFNDLNRIYNDMIHNDLVTISVIGDIDFDEVEKQIEDTFDFKERTYIPILLDTETKSFSEVTKTTKIIDVNQAKLVVGYRNEIHYLSEDYYKALVFNVLFGASSESMLFKEIREEKGLVYFINTSYDPYKGVVFITAGINPKDYNNVLDTTEKIISNIIEMNYDDDLLTTAKTIINNRLIESLDSNGGLLSRLFRNSLFHNEFNIELTKQEIFKVTKNDVSDMAKKLKLDTIYLLRGDKDE